MRVRYVVFAVWASGCVVNGKAFGPSVGASAASGASASASADGSTGGSSSASESGFEAPAPARGDDTAPYASAPVDPWLAVHGDQPKRWSKQDASWWHIRTDETQCTPLRDHCLDKDTWFIVLRDKMHAADDRWQRRRADPAVFGPDAPVFPVNAENGVLPSEDFTAYRTVPATRRNLVPGAIVIRIQAERLPTSGFDAIRIGWWQDEVASVDWDAGTYRVKDARFATNDLSIAHARLAVLAWKPGGKVEILGGKRRDQLAVAASDVFVPKP